MKSDAQHPSILGGIDVNLFIEEYWDKKPLFIKNSVKSPAPFSNDDLASLALQYDVESRLVQGNFTDGNWQLDHGPFSEDQLQNLPDKDWSLLIQGAEQWNPACAEFFKLVDWLPSWIFDDIMVSLSPEGGGVGPHIDSYGVFLIQLEGTRVWQVSEPNTKNTNYDPKFPLKILKSFEPMQEWVCEPGDVLYLPAHIAHYGVTKTDFAQTYSIGILPPRMKDLFLAYCMDYAESIDDDLRLSPNLRPVLSDSSDENNALSDPTLESFRELLKMPIHDPNTLKQWLTYYLNENS